MSKSTMYKVELWDEFNRRWDEDDIPDNRLEDECFPSEQEAEEWITEHIEYRIEYRVGGLATRADYRIVTLGPEGPGQKERTEVYETSEVDPSGYG